MKTTLSTSTVRVEWIENWVCWLPLLIVLAMALSGCEQNARGLTVNETSARDACKTINAETASGTAVYTYRSKGFTMLGLPTVTATISTTGNNGELDSQLFDVSPTGTERLISRGAYRLTNKQSGQITFQLHGNGYYFPAGDEVKLVLLGSDPPYLRKSNDQTFTVRVSKVAVSLPTR